MVRRLHRRSQGRYLTALFVVALIVLPLGNTASAQMGTRSHHLTTMATSTVSQEIPSLRTRTSRTVLLSSGLYSAQIYPGSINYQDASGVWQPIDNTLIPATTAGYAYENKANRYTVLFPSDLSQGPIRVQTAAGWVAFSLPGASGAGSVSGGGETYTLPWATIAFTAGNDELKETVTLEGPASPSTFAWTLQTSSGLSPRQSAAGGIDFVDGSGKVQFGFAPPTMQDKAGVGSHAVSLALSQGSSGQVVTLSANPAWLADASRQWPVVIDPTVTFGGASQDCYLDSSQPNYRYCGAQGLAARYIWHTDTDHALLQFNLSSIPSSAQIQSATLAVVGYDSGATTSVDVDRVTHPWNGAATWTTFDGGNPWTTPGGDYATPPAATDASAGNGSNNFSLTSLVAARVAGTTTNDGVLVKQSSESYSTFCTKQFYFYSSEYSTAADWPSLTVTYSGVPPTTWGPGSATGSGVVPWDAATGMSITRFLGLEANPVTGNLMVQSTGLHLPGVNGFDETIDPLYNSLSAGITSDLGYGWLMGAGRDVGLIANGTIVTFYDETGHSYPFTFTGTGNFTSPPGIDAKHVQNHDASYTLTFNASGARDQFNSSGYLTAMTNLQGNTISFTYSTVLYNGSYQLQSVTNTEGQTTTIAYNGNTVARITDSTGTGLWKYTYDGSGNLQTITDPPGKTTTFGYDGSHDLTQITDGRGDVTTITYDSSHRVTSIVRVITPSTNYTTTFTYAGSSTQITDPNGGTTTVAYDGSGRITAVTNVLGHTTQFTWTSDDHIASVQLPSGHTTSYTYDSTNNLTKVTTPNGMTSTLAYSNVSFPYSPTSVTDTQGNTTTVQYTSQGLPSTVTDALGHGDGFSYNTNGTIAAVTNANSATTSLSYTSPGLLGQVTPPSPLGATSYSYSGLDQVSTVTDGAGHQVTSGIDALGDPSTVSSSSGSYTYSYDQADNLASMYSAGQTTTYAYDVLNRIQSVTDPGGSTTRYGFDGDNNPTFSANGHVLYYWGAPGQLSELVDQQGKDTVFRYDVDGNLTKVSYPNGVAEALSYNTVAQLTGITDTNSSNQTILSYTYNYTNPSTNQPTALPYTVTRGGSVLTTWTQTNSFNADNELTQAARGSAAYTYGYDNAGNLTAENLNGNATTLTYNAAGELTKANSTTYSYDGAGNETGTSGGASASYNAFDQTTGLTQPGQPGASMSYTGPDELQRTGAGSDTYQYDAVAGLTAMPSASATFSNTPGGGPIEESAGASGYYYLTDGQGSVVAVTDNSGAVARGYNYDPNGNTISQSGSVNNPLGWHGMVHATSSGGTYYTAGNSGYYDPAVAAPTQNYALGGTFSASGMTYASGPYKLGVGTTGENFALAATSNASCNVCDPPFLSAGGRCSGRVVASIDYSGGVPIISGKGVVACNQIVSDLILVLRAVPYNNGVPLGKGFIIAQCTDLFQNGLLCAGEGECPAFGEYRVTAQLLVQFLSGYSGTDTGVSPQRLLCVV